MATCFEDEFMDIQTDLISLCLELTESKVDKIYAYASIEQKSTMFNAFFEKNGNVITTNQLNVSMDVIMEFLKIGTMDLQKIKKVCEVYNTPVPTQLKMYYDVNSGKYNADYKYEAICSSKLNVSPGEVFMQWLEEIKNNVANK